MRVTQPIGRALSCIAFTAFAGAAAAAGPRTPRSPDPPVQKVTLTATDYRFTPSTIHAVAGQPLEITIVNHGTKTHGLRLVLSYGEAPFPENVPPGQTTSTVFNNLGEPGTYRFYCPVEDHARRGMQGTLVIAPAK
jgi:plastocyanin